MEAKTFEVRDRMTFIPVLCVRLLPKTEADRYLIARAGYGQSFADQGEYILLMRLDGGSGHYECAWEEWPQNIRTIPRAHKHITEHWHELESGAVIDVEFVLGERAKPKTSERFDDL